jgi:hypothetical protein
LPPNENIEAGSHKWHDCSLMLGLGF